MPLDKKDLNNIRVVVKDIVDFAIEKSEMKLENKFAADLKRTEERIITQVNREVNDITETNREFLEKMGDHETRIERPETEVGAKTA